MRRIVESCDEGFDSLLGEKVCLFGLVYIYTGKLVGVNEDHLKLEEAMIVYETGELSSGDWRDAQPLPGVWRVQKSAIESWGKSKC